jgi:hypothetical protein
MTQTSERKCQAGCFEPSTFVPPAPRPGFAVQKVRADEVEVGDYFIPMDGPNYPVGKGKTWRICNQAVDPQGIFFDSGSIALGWGHTYRWAHSHQLIYVMRPINTRTNGSARKA